MRTARFKAEKNLEQAYYHCISRVVERRFALGEAEKEKFVRILRSYEDFCGVRLVTFCVMSNHFHVLVEVPRRPEPEDLPTDAELVRRLYAIGCDQVAATVEDDLAWFRKAGQIQAAEELREQFFRRMWDISWYMRLVKQRFSQWLNSRTRRTGTLWEGRFRSLLVEGKGTTLATMAAYIDLNPIRAGIVDDPKDYRWSGYGEAVAGSKLARAGLRTAIALWLQNQKLSESQALANYRSYLYQSGREGTAASNATNGTKPRRGFTPEEVAAVLAKGGKLELEQALLCRVRYFCDGAILGSRAFVEGVFRRYSHCFGPKRKTASRPLRGLSTPGLFVARALRVRTLG